jgi:uncharacterized protein (TIGR00251 family)
LGKRKRVLEETKNGCYLSVEASPGARKTEFSGLDRWRGAMKISVASPPVSGKANAELIEMLEDKFPEAKGYIVLAKGEKSRSKRVFIPLDARVIRERLGLKDD